MNPLQAITLHRARVVIRRTAGLLVRLVAALAAGLAVLAALLALRLASGPVPLDVLTPYVARALAAAGGDIAVRIDHTLLSFGADGQLDLVARGLRLSRREGEARLFLPELSLGLSSRAALDGTIAPTRIAIRAPHLRLRRDADGSFHLGLGEADPAASEDWIMRLLHDLAVPPDRQGPMGYLTRVAVRGASLTVDDRVLGVVWHARGVDAALFRGGAGVSGDVALAVDAGGRRTEIHGDLNYQAASARLAMMLTVADLRPAAWAAAAPALAPLAALDLPVAGQVRVDLDTATLRLRDAWVDLSLGSGTVRHAALAGGALAVTGGALRAAYDPAAGRLAIEQAALDLGGPRVEATGTVDGLGDLGGDMLAGRRPELFDIDIALRASALPVEDFPRLWPEGLATDTRQWVVEHIHDGTVDQAAARLRLHLDLPPDGAAVARLDRLDGTLAYHGLAVDYFKPLPPARDVDGTAVFDRTHIDFVPTGGTLRGVKVTAGRVHLYQLDTHDEQAAIDLTLNGPLRDALQVLDAKPLEYARELSVDPARVAGRFDARVTFKFPLVRHLGLAQVDFGADATLKGVGIGNAMFGRDLSAGDLALKLDRAALRLDGTAKLAGVPMTLGWTQSLDAKNPVRTRYAVRARLDAAARKALGLDLFPGVLSGPVDVDLVYAVRARKRARATVALDLEPARVAVDALGWTKPAGTPATARLDLDFTDERLTALRDAVVTGGGMDARLSARFADQGDGTASVSRIDIARLIVGETDVAGSVTRRPEGGWRVQLAGLSFDASALLADRDRPPPSETPDPPLVIEAKLDRLVLGPKREARAVSGQLFSDGLHWQAASIDATLLGGGKATLRFGRVAGDRSFHLATDDFGALLRLFDISDNVKGGQLQITGQVEAAAGSPRRLRGRVAGADYRIVGAPLLARLLSVASFSGIGALLSGEGIPFARLTGDFVYDGERLRIDGLRAYGGAIGVNAGGNVDFRTDALDVSGTLVPAYALNSVLGNIPILGDLLLGGEGQGIFGANFRVAGPLAEPRISVNPLSALAPGFLRKLFLFEPGDPSKPPPADPRPALGP